MTRAGLASRSALCLSLAASLLGSGCTTGVIEFVSNTSGASAAGCSDGEGTGCDEATAPVQRVCEPGARQCSSDLSKVETCNENGTAWVQSVACAAREACTEATCVDMTRVVGKVVVLGPADNREVPLGPGKYGLAVVNNVVASPARELPFPVEISGELIAQATAASAAQARPRLPLVSHPPRIRLRRAEGARAAATTTPRIYQVGDRRIFNYYDPDGTSSVNKRVGEMRHSGATVNIWEDVTTSPRGWVIGDADLREVVRRLDSGGVARNIAVFGAPTDVDGNGKADVFVTPLQNGKGAFISPDTLYPEGYYPDNDFGEIVYLCGPSETEDVAWLASSVLHELTHLTHHGVRLQPYLNPPRDAPPWTDVGVYIGEGPAVLAELLSGQDNQTLVAWGLYYPQSWALGDLFTDDYDKDENRNNVLYGMAGVFFDYLFEQAGGVDITSPASVTDRGGQAFLQQFFRGTDRVARLALADGRGVEQAYVDMAAALLRGSLTERLHSLSGDQPSLYAFRPVQQDPVFGHLIGVPQRYEDYYPNEEARPALVRTDWSQHPWTLREGGAAFHDVVVGQGGAMLKNSNANTHVVLLRYSDLQ